MKDSASITNKVAKLLVFGLILATASPSLHAQTSAFVVNPVTGAIDQVVVPTMQLRASGGLAAGRSPRAFVLVPGSSRAWVASATGNSVTAYDTATQQIAAAVPLTAAPHSLAVCVNGARVYVSVPDANAVVVIATATNTVEATVTVGSRPLGLALSRDGNRLYVANSGGRSISVIATATHTVTRTITLSSVEPAHVAVTVDDQFLLVTEVSGTNLVVVNLMFGDVFRTVALGGVGQSVSLVPDGTRIYVPISSGVVTIDTATFLAAGTMTDVGTPGAVAFNSSGTAGYVTDTTGGRLVAFDPTTLIVSSEITLAAGVSAVALPQPMAPQSGWWWNTSEPGRGYALEVYGWKIIYSPFVYDVDGDPLWYMAYLATTDGETYTGDLLQYRNGQSLGGAYQAPQLVGTVGPVSLRFTSPTSGTATHLGAPITVQRYDVVANGVAAGRGSGMPQTGWWWGPTEWGRGYFVETQNDNFFFGAFMYDSLGDAAWYSATGTVSTSGFAQAALAKCRNGQPLLDTTAYKQGVCTTDQGTITIQFQSGSTATLTLPNGASVALERVIY